MTDTPRGPTTEELQARVLAQLAEAAIHEPRRLLDALTELRDRAEGRTFYDPARPPADVERGSTDRP